MKKWNCVEKVYVWMFDNDAKYESVKKSNCERLKEQKF